ncbi:MAG: FAD:protein FMN transferase [Angelakisella sp.]
MKKNFLSLCALLTALLLIGGCAQKPAEPQYQKYQMQFFGAFDTVIQLVGYTTTEQEFTEYADYTQKRFVELSHTFDRFYEYEGINNIRTVNLKAGIAPVKVDPIVLDVIDLCRQWYTETDGQINIAMGSVLSVWHDYMELYADDPQGAKLPSTEELNSAAKHMNMDDIITDREAGTVYLAEKGMVLDTGAVAKGYCAQVVADELYALGFTSFIISAGGNVVTADPPLDGIRKSWGIGIQDPFADVNDPNSPSTEVMFVTGESVVTSGDYQRFYMVGDKRIHHIIDPDTLMPADYYRGLTIVHEDSGMADLFSTSLFCMDYPTSRAFAEKHGLKVLWILPDGSVEYTDNLLPQLRDRGGATAAIDK